MNDINSDDLIEELKFDIKTNDLIKARLVMAHLPEVSENIQKIVFLCLSQAKDTFTAQLIISLLADHPEFGEQFPMLKEIIYSKFLSNPDILTNLFLKETKSQNRIILAEIAGEMRMEQAAPILLGIINAEQDEKMLCRAIEALGMIGDVSATSPISEYLYSNNVELTIAAIYALGQFSTPTAIQRLSEKLGADPDLDIMILDVFHHSQMPEALEKLNETLSAHWAHTRNAAKQRLVQIGAKAVPELIKNLRYDDPDLLIHTLNVLGEIGDESAIAAIRKLLFKDPKDANVRFAAYEALGLLPVSKGAVTLAAGLNDPVENVRTAAANAINHNYNAVLAAGLKNMIREENSESEQICKTIITAQCDTIFLDLIQEDSFVTMAMEFLNQHAHPDVKSYYIRLLNENGHISLADKLKSSETTVIKESTILRIFAVDDSKMILNIYRSALHDLGYEPVLFEFPADAVKAIEHEHPAAILTDLNMPDINGIELTRQIRKIHDKDALPIIMVTTQNEVNDNEAALAAGVNGIIRKPFTAENLAKALGDWANL
ncbi:MAG: response regulator [Desulfobacteraceae bacterium]|jgi:CheY-like chemotaxis protein